MIDKSMEVAGTQGELFRPVNNYRLGRMRALSPHTAPQYESTQIIKQEQVDNEKNDSGLHSSSPDSNTSQESRHSYDHLMVNGFYQQAQNRPFVYASPILPQAAMFKMNLFNSNPLTPPDSACSNRTTPKSDHEEADLDSTLVMHSPHRNEDNHNHIKSLEMSVKQNLYTTRSGESASSNDDLKGSLKVPKINSHGKMRTFKCKYCKRDFFSKEDLWSHLTSHIPKERQLACTEGGCTFVTEFKHHWEYHMKKHTGCKPFQCDKCDYACSTKSMLTSHNKSHTNLYQYTCKDCAYASKYCHAFKVHLRRYKHEPNVPLDENGKPAPDIVIDVYGKRRGPRVKKSQTSPHNDQSLTEDFDIGKLMQTQSLNLLPPVYPPVNLQLMQGLLQIRALAAAAAASHSVVAEPQEQVLDLSRSGSGSWEESASKRPRTAFPTWLADTSDEETKETRRSFNSSPGRPGDDDLFEEKERCTTMFSTVEAVVQAPESPKKETVTPEIEKKCHHCNMTFGDEALYHIHMSHHGSPNPFTCNMCKEECKDKVAFSLHIIRVAH